MYYQKGELDRAIADYTQAIKLEPGIVGNLTGRGYAYQAKGQYDRAIADYDDAIRVKPDHVLAYHDRGFAYFAKGEITRAISDYSEAIRLDQQYVMSYRNRGVAQLYSSAPANALADLEIATQLKPTDAYAPLWREIASWRANAPSILAQTASHIDMATWPGPVVRYFLGETTQAALIAAATNADPKKNREQLCEANFFVGQLALHRGLKEEAKRAFQAALLDCPRQFLEAGAASAEFRIINSND